MDRVEQYSRLMINQIIKYFGKEIEKVQDNVICIQDERTIAQLFNKSDDADVRYSYLFQLLGNECSILALHLCVAAYIFPEFYEALRKITGRGVTYKLACEICGNAGGESLPPSEAGEAFRRLVHIVRVEKERTNFLYSELYCDSRLVEYLRGEDSLSVSLKGMVYEGSCKRELYGVEKETAQLEKLIARAMDRNDALRFVQVAGEKGSGRRSIVLAAARRSDTRVIYVDYGLCRQRKEKTEELVGEAVREALLYDGFVCLHNIEYEDLKKEDFSGIFCMLHRLTDTFGIPVIICTLQDVQLSAVVDELILKINLDMRAFEKREALWRGLSLEHGVGLDTAAYASKYSLLPGQVVKIWEIAGYDIEPGMKSTELEKVLSNAAADVIELPDKGTIIKHKTSQRLSDLMLPDDAAGTLRMICAYARERYKVFSQWGMDRKYPYGKGMAALFVGGPGTGKTMAAGCIANELGLLLYKVDLSQIVDKYIGETEKKLEQVFTYAQKSNVVLFFDEADALFGKRSEVKDSKDKYANTEVSYILQRIEQYDGMVILATNLVKNMDEAFLRRMKYMVEFPMPDENIRYRIWKNSFPASVPVKEIDFEFLAGRVELAGGHIKNIILNAAFIAAGRDEAVGMGAILYAVKNEYYKLGRTLGRDFFGRYWDEVINIMES